jgi:peptidoglycan/xylan/chitin deacetylase (PgdA/CDA1 family)
MAPAALLVALALVAALVPQTPQPSAARTRTIAVTFDDLPFVAAGGPYFPAASRATTELLRILRRHKAPAVGFVNEAQLDAAGDRAAPVGLLQQWIDAGMTLGNHTYSHPDFNGLTIEEFKDQIVRGEPTIRRLMAARSAKRLFFRHPMTHTGDTQAKKEAIEQFLDQRGYTIAPHTIENSDFIFNAVYRRAQAAGDTALAARVRQAYLDHTFAATAFAENISPAIFRREVTQTLLLHSNTLNADTLDDLLSRYEARGYRFVTLEEAMADPAYATKDTLVSTYGPTWLWRWMKSLGMNVSFSADPEVPAWILEAYKRSAGVAGGL